MAHSQVEVGTHHLTILDHDVGFVLSKLVLPLTIQDAQFLLMLGNLAIHLLIRIG